MTFVIDGDVDTQIKVTEIEGSLYFEITVLGTGSVGDLRGLFVDLEGYEADDSLYVTGDDVTGSAFGEVSVSTVGGDANVKGEVVNELGAFDLGVAFGSSGLGEDDIQQTSFTLSSESGSLTLDMLSLADIALRYTSVGTEDGERNDALKIGGTIPEAPPAETGFDNEFTDVNGLNLFNGYAGDTLVDGLGGDDVLMGDYAEMQLAVRGSPLFLNQAGSSETFSIGDDSISGGAGEDIVIGDTKSFGLISDLLSPDSPRASLQLEAGNDTLSGGDDADVMYGDIQSIVVFPGEAVAWSVIMGDDTIDGDGGDDILVGDVGLESGLVDPQPAEIRMGSDVLRGGDGDDMIVGDVLTFGGTNVENLVGGDDTIVGGAGNDTLYGDASASASDLTAGADVFVFEPGSGLDTIMDFDAGLDLIDISAYGFADFPQLQMQIETTVGGDTVIDLDGTAGDVDEITVVGVVGLNEDSFILA